ncbi:hypothetical protein NM213_21670 [Pseudomonas lactis]|uniref:Transmembrane protein n=2 Tax=Pseudomonas lactis TaxID=1615674 RepID=I4K8I5_9PSED|nr:MULTISPECIES: hypothetical protein [Pseudomonas]MBD8562532.1 hypothetical protein [Pseudomonas fluorescens]EIK61025.1 hypothetical protein PflSS101_1964 [Pseudomonas lactis]KRP82375.1 hypothetical protein TX24_08750 [Pseudomonas lactis]MBI6978721.1 hypothetical protein [Pseudomonas lactis]MBR7213231.1 hypothetical protein [Pseudomonas sp. B2021]
MSPKRFPMEFAVILLVYVLCVVVSSVYMSSMPDGVAKIALALLPVIPMIAMAVSIIRRLNAMDEMGRKIQLEALAVAFVCTALTTFSYGFLETAGFPRMSAFMVWPIMGGVWCVATIIGSRRYQ